MIINETSSNWLKHLNIAVWWSFIFSFHSVIINIISDCTAICNTCIIIVTYIIYYNNSLVCSEGEFRLVSEVFGDGFTVTGILEVCINSTWTSVCSDSVELEDPMVQAQAEITCDVLGYTGVCFK